MRALKPYLQTLLRRVCLYQRVKASCIYDFYWRMADKRIINDRCREIDFYHKLLEGFRLICLNSGEKDLSALRCWIA